MLLQMLAGWKWGVSLVLTPREIGETREFLNATSCGVLKKRRLCGSKGDGGVSVELRALPLIFRWA
jgi:hypothetical protein